MLWQLPEIVMGKAEVTINLRYLVAPEELALGGGRGWDLNTSIGFFKNSLLCYYHPTTRGASIIHIR